MNTADLGCGMGAAVVLGTASLPVWEDEIMRMKEKDREIISTVNASVNSDSRSVEETAAGVGLSPSERTRMLEDIARIGAALGKDLADSARCGLAEPPLPVSPMSAGGASEPGAPLERLRLLHSLLPTAEAALTLITRRPADSSQPQTVTVPAARSRGSRAAARSVACGPHAARGEPSAPILAESLIVNDLRAEVGAGSYANRLVATLLIDMEREANVLAALSAFCGEEAEAARAVHAAERLRQWRAATFLSTLTPLTARERSGCRLEGAVSRSAPPYRALFGVWRTLYRSLRFDWSGSPLLCLPALPAWHLYEIWCYLTTARVLREQGRRLVGGEAVRWEANGLRLALAAGKGSRLRFMHGDSEVVLLYQPWFSGANRAPRGEAERTDSSLPGFASSTHAMQPDIALLHQDRLYLLDPKFRAYLPDAPLPTENERSLTDSTFGRAADALYRDIDKMHAYKDALVRAGAPSVEAAWCLFPGAPAADAPVIAYPAAHPQAEFGTAGIGALRLRPAGDLEAFRRLLASWLP